MDKTDYCGHLIEDDEADDAEIYVWEVEPHPLTTDYDSMLVRSWQRFVEIMENNIGLMIERPTADDLLSEPLTIKVSLRKMSKHEYEGLEDDE